MKIDKKVIQELKSFQDIKMILLSKDESIVLNKQKLKIKQKLNSLKELIQEIEKKNKNLKTNLIKGSSDELLFKCTDNLQAINKALNHLTMSEKANEQFFKRTLRELMKNDEITYILNCKIPMSAARNRTLINIHKIVGTYEKLLQLLKKKEIRSSLDYKIQKTYTANNLRGMLNDYKRRFRQKQRKFQQQN